jgi:transcriptional regulator
MYLPEHFAQTDISRLHDTIASHPFGCLITHGVDGLDANHLPFELLRGEGALGLLNAHIARRNPLPEQVKDGDEVLVTFRAADAYVSPSYYPSKQLTQRQVPTWNYMVVHAHGRIRFVDDEKFLRAVVGQLTRTHEANQPAPWKMADAPAEYLQDLLQNIVGVQIVITRLLGKNKLGQDEDLTDMQGAGQALAAGAGGESQAVGCAMLALARLRE